MIKDGGTSWNVPENDTERNKKRDQNRKFVESVFERVFDEERWERHRSFRFVRYRGYGIGYRHLSYRGTSDRIQSEFESQDGCGERRMAYHRREEGRYL